MIFIVLHANKADTYELKRKKRADIDLEVHFAFAVDEGGLLVFAQGKPLVLHEAYTRLLRNHAALNVSQLATAPFGLLAESVIQVTKSSSVSTFTAAIFEKMRKSETRRNLIHKKIHISWSAHLCPGQTARPA